MATAPVTVQFEVTDPFTGRMAHLALAAHLLSCRVCRHYYARRGNTMLLAVVVEANRRGVSAPRLMLRYIRSVHDRHVAGESLSTRHHTPVKQLGQGRSRIKVQRSCNGCQKRLGDANTTELDAAVDGRLLPDVRLECGCWSEDVAA